MKALEYAKAGADAIMNKFKPEELPPNHRFHYHQGIFLLGVERLYQLTGDTKYKEYIKAWVDYNIDEEGNAPRCYLTEFDDMQPAMLLFRLYEETGDERYKTVLQRIHDALEKWPTNAYGGIWHKYSKKNQMWLDSMYMMGVITAMCANFFDNPYLYQKIHTQMVLMRDHMTNPATGLLYHMWDDSKEVEFVDKKTGCVPVHWGRAMGWYVIALAEILEHMPQDCPCRQDFIDTEIKYLNAIRKYQDSKTGMWYQVLNLTDESRNWEETSCTALFTYAIAKARNIGIIGAEFDDMLQAGYRGVINKTNFDGGMLNVTGVCVGTNVNYLDYYFDRPIVTNDLHGMGAFLLMCTEVSRG